jgi:hypothetical protein
VFLGFVPAFYGISAHAKVRCKDNDQIETLPSADLIPAYFVTSRRD